MNRLLHFVKTQHLSRDHIYFLKCLSLNYLSVRKESALYVTGDKARDNYVVLQPYMDFAKTFQKSELLEYSINQRKMPIDLQEVQQMFEQYKKAVKEIDLIEDSREMIAKQLKELTKSANTDECLLNTLKDKGKALRNEMKTKRDSLYPLEDAFIQSYLKLPTLLHPHCPEGDFEKILYRSNQLQKASSKSHLDNEHLIRFIDNSRYYLMNEAAAFDLHVTDALVSYLLRKGNFIQTCNPDFVRSVLLEANAKPLEHYHKVVEQHLQNKLNGAYLAGGAAFESFLGAVTKLCVFPSVIPLKYVCSGRLYEKSFGDETPSLYSATQTNAVQTFVATTSLQQSEEQMDAILNMCVDFYKTFTNLHFRIVYVKAADLTPSENLRAQIEVYSPHEKRYVCVGRISNYSDFVSKRILFTMRDQKDYKFLHLVGGPILFTSRLIAALIESDDSLDFSKVLESLKLTKVAPKQISNKSIDEFQSLFK